MAGLYPRADRRKNRISHPMWILNHGMVPEPQHDPAFALEPRRASLVIGDCRAVLAAIELDRHPGCAAGEVEDERTDDELPREARAGAREAAPQDALGARAIVAQLARVGGQALVDAAHGVGG